MPKLTSGEYKAMAAAVGNRHVTDELHRAVQAAFGNVDGVTQYWLKGLVQFDDGQKWIYNFNKLYPTFYRVDIRCDEFKKAY